MTTETRSYGEMVMLEIAKYREKNECDIMDGILWFCDKYNISPDVLVSKLPNQEKQKIRQELIEGRYVRMAVAKPSAKLPISETR